MSIKDLFGKNSKSLEETVKDVESEKFLEEKTKKQERYIPPVDFSDPKNFVYYGSAELYYDSAIKRIYEDFPYDGSKAEQIEFHERASYLERWVYENKYPKTTGYITLGTTGQLGSLSGVYSSTTQNEFIKVWGGLHTDDNNKLQDKFQKSAKYDESKNRNQNWNCDFDKGVTVEFWLKKETYNAGREVILDLYNGKTVGSTDYSRMTIEIEQDSGSNYFFFVRFERGSYEVVEQITSASIDMSSWKHYALSISKNEIVIDAKLYLNGNLYSEKSISATDAFVGKLDGYIGALQETTISNGGAKGYGKLQASIDEFRFWKTKRTARQIKLNWFSQVGGGANTDDATSDLGVYFKFNEGIVGSYSTDSVVLDYSGRMANGLWVGYPAGSARSEDSALEAAGYTEEGTPIIYPDHPNLSSLIEEMQISGSNYDNERGQAFYNSMPTWMQEEDNGHFRFISQILGSYLDTLHVQIRQVTELKNKEYPTEYSKPSTIAKDLLEEKGFVTSQMFESNEVFEKLSKINLNDQQYVNDLSEIKNIIYTNIYNNLEKIYKTKGTEASIRNLIRCFGIDDELIKLNLYTDGGIQYLSDKTRTTSVKKKYIDFNNPDHFSSTIYQTSSADNPNSFIYGSHTLIDGSKNAFTFEADIVVPYKKEMVENGYFSTPFLSSSLFGFHEANPDDSSDLTWWGQNQTLFYAEGLIFFDVTSHYTWAGETITLISTDGTTRTYVFDNGGANSSLDSFGRVRINMGTLPYNTANNIGYAIASANGHAGKILTSYTYNNFSVYQAEPGPDGNTTISTSSPTFFTITNFAGGLDPYFENSSDLQVFLVRDSRNSKHAKFVLKNELQTIYQESDYIYDIYDNEHYNVAIRIKPQTYPYAGGVTNTEPDYEIELYAVTNNFGEIKEEVLISQTVDYSTGSAYIRAPKRVYAGAHRTNFIGSVQEYSDAQIGRVSAWLDYLGDEEILEHNKDVLNYGQRKAIDGSNIYMVDGVHVPTQELSILSWDFDTVLSSDSAGEFIVEDTTSGHTDEIYGWIDDIIRREHKAKGDFFNVENKSFLVNNFLSAKKKQLPETAFNSENIFIKGESEINFAEDEDVSDNLFILEKSPSALISEEMLKSFSTTMEFANLFGRPVDRFRIEYKDLARARDLFFQRVDSDLDFDKFFGYFKWIDSSISSMVNQLIPLSANFSGGIVDVIEPHILERDKYQRRVGLLDTVTSTESSIKGIQELTYNWKFGHAPEPLTENENCLWQKTRKERDTEELEAIRTTINLLERTSLEGSTLVTRKFSQPYSLNVGFSNSIHGGINYNKNKNRDFLSTVVTPHGDKGTASQVPVNIVTIGAGEGNGLNPLIDCLDELKPNQKIKRDGYAQIGKYSDLDNLRPLSDDLHSVYRRKVSHIIPGNFVSSSVNKGYTAQINKGGTAQGFANGVDLVNLHSDTTDITNEIPMQGPFTQHWVGGHQSRHVWQFETGSKETRPEFWRLLVGQSPIEKPEDDDGAIGFTGPDYGAPYPVTDWQKAIYYREGRTKRPLNVRNIRTDMESGSAGNFVYNYEFLSTFGDQKYFLRRSQDDLLPDLLAVKMPETTNYLSLVGKSIGPSGNVALANLSNRMPDGENVLIDQEISYSYSNAYFSLYTNDGIDRNGDSISVIQFPTNSTITVGTDVDYSNEVDEVNFNNVLDEVNNVLAYGSVATLISQIPSQYYLGLKMEQENVDDSSNFLGYYGNGFGDGSGTKFCLGFLINPHSTEFPNDVECTVANLGNSRKIYFKGTTLYCDLYYSDSNLDNFVDRFSVNLATHFGSSFHVFVDTIGTVGTLNTSGAVKIFINNILVTTVSETLGEDLSSGGAMPTGSLRFIDTATSVTLFRNLAKGKTTWIDELVLYNAAVDSGPRANIYNNLPDPAVSTVGLVAHLSLSSDDFSNPKVGSVTGDELTSGTRIYSRFVTTDPNAQIEDFTLSKTSDFYAYFAYDEDNRAGHLFSGGTGTIRIATPDASEQIYGPSFLETGDLFYNLIGSTATEEVTNTYFNRPKYTTENQDRSVGSNNVIRTRFSAPGGSETLSKGFLDVATQQYSPYNSINYRNLSVRMSGSGEEGNIAVNSHANNRDGLRILRTRHQDKFGYDSIHNTDPSWHKQHRNTKRKLAGDEFGDHRDLEKTYDNENYNTPIPSSDFQYSWINNAVVSGSDDSWLEKQIISGYAPKSGVIGSSMGYEEAIKFPERSDVYSNIYFGNISFALSQEFLNGGGYPVTLTNDQEFIIDDYYFLVSDLKNLSLNYSYSGPLGNSVTYKKVFINGSGYNFNSGDVLSDFVANIFYNPGCKLPVRIRTVDNKGNEEGLLITFVNVSTLELTLNPSIQVGLNSYSQNFSFTLLNTPTSIGNLENALFNYNKDNICLTSPVVVSLSEDLNTIPSSTSTSMIPFEYSLGATSTLYYKVQTQVSTEVIAMTLNNVSLLFSEARVKFSIWKYSTGTEYTPYILSQTNDTYDLTLIGEGLVITPDNDEIPEIHNGERDSFKSFLELIDDNENEISADKWTWRFGNSEQVYESQQPPPELKLVYSLGEEVIYRFSVYAWGFRGDYILRISNASLVTII